MCIFCDIVAGKIPCSLLYEDETVMAFLDISQVTKGHTLVIPKKHVSNLLACEREDYLHLMEVVQTLGNHIMDTLHCEGMNILSNVCEVAGQSVPHFHVHLIPRYSEQDACIIRFAESEPQDLVALQHLLAYK